MHPRRITFSLVVLGLASVLIAGTSLQNPPLLSGFGGGLFLGVLLGFVGLHLTRFETTDEGHFYTPNTHIGVAISLLLAARIAYRFMVFGGFSTMSNHPPPMQSPLTFFIIGLTFGYYLAYYTGLFVHTRDKK